MCDTNPAPPQHEIINLLLLLLKFQGWEGAALVCSPENGVLVAPKYGPRSVLLKDLPVNVTRLRVSVRQRTGG